MSKEEPVKWLVFEFDSFIMKEIPAQKKEVFLFSQSPQLKLKQLQITSFLWWEPLMWISVCYAAVLSAIDGFPCSLTQTSCVADCNSLWKYNGIRSHLCWCGEKSNEWIMTKFYFYRNQRSYEISNWLPHFSISLNTWTEISLLRCSALLMREDLATGRDSSMMSFLCYVLILYLTWVLPFYMGCIVAPKATDRATHESTLKSYLGMVYYQLLVPGGYGDRTHIKG